MNNCTCFFKHKNAPIKCLTFWGQSIIQDAFFMLLLNFFYTAKLSPQPQLLLALGLSK